jgi:ABC-type uncharacterized transport system permease subunit
MDQYINTLIVVISMVALVSLVMTVWTGRRKRKKSRDDAPDSVLSHPVIGNPVFWGYAAFLALVFVTIAYFFFIYGES